jgi:hypothetical protein
MTLTIHSPSFLAETGQDIDLFPAPSELTFVQAMKFLRMSERHLNDLLVAGEFTFRLENGERLLQLDSLVEYKQDRERGQAKLDKLFDMFREAGMSDDYD